MHLKLKISHCFERISCENAVHFSNIGLMQQLMKKLISAIGDLKTRAAYTANKIVHQAFAIFKIRAF